MGEAPGEREVDNGIPFSGPSGWFLDDLLKAAGLHRSQLFLTNVCRHRPPDNDLEDKSDPWLSKNVKAPDPAMVRIEGLWVNPKIAAGLYRLHEEIEAVRPQMVICVGNLALWALTGKLGIRKWRASTLQGHFEDGAPYKIFPTIHPAAVLREMSLQPTVVTDFKRAVREFQRGPVVTEPKYNFLLRPTFRQAVDACTELLRKLDCAPSPLPLGADIETRAGHIACLGIATSKVDAFCIPFMCVERVEGYWSLQEETHLVILLRHILTHPKAKVIWQNGAYDHQYLWRWHFYLPSLGWDTMLAQHAMFSISLKSLDYLSSLYCDTHVYWKDDGKTWDPSIPEDELWRYNCEDCVHTFEIAEGEQQAITALIPTWPKLPSVVDFQHKIQPVIVKMMHRGVRSDESTRQKMRTELRQACNRLQAQIDRFAGQSLNVNSSKQMTEFFYGILAQSPIYSRGPYNTRGNLTCDDEALLTIASREPILRPLITRIQSLRSGEKFLSTYIEMSRDMDGRLRCSYNVAGTKTYRLASSENAFGSGGNLQNIPTGDEDDLTALLQLPNIRRLFLFDPDRIGFDLDGDSADLRIVTGESGCRQMQAYFAAGVKPYVEIAKEFYRDSTITKHHPSYKRMKALCHGSNYGGEPVGLSARIGLPVIDIDRMQRWYFGMCPEIARWQNDIRSQCEHRGYIENPFGYRLWRWDRYSRKIANEFLAWTPQSTVGLLINKIAYALDQQLPEVELLLQVHDSLTGQFPADRPELRQRILDIAGSIEIPCRTGAIIVPAGMKTSTTSWGDCK